MMVKYTCAAGIPTILTSKECEELLTRESIEILDEEHAKEEKQVDSHCASTSLNETSGCG